MRGTGKFRWPLYGCFQTTTKDGHEESMENDLRQKVTTQRSGETSFSLLALPDGVITAIAENLMPTSLANLQMTCTYLNSMLRHERLWQRALQLHDPIWAASGICPVPRRNMRCTWKELVGASVKLQPGGIGGDLRESPEAVCAKGLKLWNTAKTEEMKMKLDWHLCHTEHESSEWRRRLANHQFELENIADLRELIYFLWYEARQLARACKTLLKVMRLLAEDRASASVQVAEERLGYGTRQNAITAACAGLYLIDLLHMKSLHHSPMSVNDPNEFLMACHQGHRLPDKGGGSANNGSFEKFEWCGGQYTYEDLRAALLLLSASECLSTNHDQHPQHSCKFFTGDASSWPASNQSQTPQFCRCAEHQTECAKFWCSQTQQPQYTAGHLFYAPESPSCPARDHTSDADSGAASSQDHPQPCGMISAEPCVDPWLPASWELFKGDAKDLLLGLASAEYIPWGYLYNRGAFMKARVADLRQGRADAVLAPSDTCRFFTFYAACIILHRLHPGPGCHFVYAETGQMYDASKQYTRAAHYYKMHIMTFVFGSTFLPGQAGDYSALIGLAVAYHWDSVKTGAPQSYRQAFEWQRFTVRSLVQNAGQPELLSRQAVILGDMLSSAKSGAASAPYLHQNSRLVLAAGAYLAHIRRVKNGDIIAAWLQSSFPVLAVAEQAFYAFLKNADEAFSIIAKDAARRRASHQQADRNRTGRNVTVPNGQTVCSPPLMLTLAHIEFIIKLARLMSRLPGGNAGQALFAIAASIKGCMSVR